MVMGLVATSGAATSGSVVGATVLAATSLDTTGCDAASRSLGTLVVGATSISPGNCAIAFGSSNETSALRVFQSDGKDRAMTQSSGTATTQQAAPAYHGAAVAGALQAWMVGAPGTGSVAPIVYTADGGATWTSQTCAGANGLYMADYVTGSTVVAVGASNSICRTTDNGTTWTRSVVAGGGGTWTGLDMLASGEGWASAAGGSIAHTLDGGVTWAALPNPDPTLSIYRIAAASSTRLYAAAYRNGASGSPYRDVVAMTSGDGGLTWTIVPLQTNITYAFARTVVALSASRAVIGTGSGIYLTTDSGATWTQQSTAGSLCVAAYDATTLVSYFNGATSVRSVDGGATWTNLAPSPALTGNAYGCRAATATVGYVGGHNDQRWTSTDAGVTYSPYASTYRDQRGVAAWNADRYVTVGDGGTVRRTVDGGTTFTEPSSGTAQALLDVETIAPNTAVAVGNAGVIVRSTNAGSTWSAVTSGTGASLRAIDRAPDGSLYVVGAAGVVLRSVDDGASWSTRTAPAAVTISDVAGFGSQGVWAAGAAGAVYRSVDGGATWVTQPTGSALTIVSMDAIDAQQAIAVTAGDGSSTSSIYRTADGGSTWTPSVLPAGILGYAARYLSETNVIVATNGGYRRSTDSGATWAVGQGAPYDNYAVAPIDVGTFVVAGASDSIVRAMPAQSFEDYVNGSVDFSGSASTFGACLHTAVGTSSTTWPVAGAGNCTAANLALWRGIAIDSSGPTAKVASTATNTTGTITMKFGARPTSGQRAGTYQAGLAFEVVAPAV